MGLFGAIADELRSRRGELRSIAAATGISYDTVRSVIANDADVGICKVQALADHLGIRVLIKAPKRFSPPSGGG